MKKLLIVLLIFGGLMVNHHNFSYAAGPTFPEAVGDRLYAQDYMRDYWSKIDDAGRKMAGGFSSFPVLIKDSNVTKGTLWTDINIPVARGIVLYEVDVPLSYAALPPTVTQEDIYCRIETTAQVDFDISATATLDGVTTNYVKVTYNETDGSSRLRAKKAGTYVYEKAVSFTITVDSVAPTNYDLVLATLVGDGAASLQIECYTQTPTYNSEYDYIVRTQEDFNVLIDYTAANQYRVKDNVKSIFVKFLSGGYQMTGATSPLQEGDSWGYIETNDCTRIVFEPGAFIDMHQERGYLEVDTDYCYLDGVSIQGDTGIASAIQRSFLLNANYVTFNNCDSQTRLSNTTFRVFEGSGTTLHNQTSRYNGCFVTDCNGSGGGASFLSCFYLCQNLENINIYDIESSGSIDLVSNCENINNIIIVEIDQTGGNISEIFDDCNNISNANITDIDGNAQILVFYDCNNISNIQINDIQTTAGNCDGLFNCDNISNCRVIQLDSVSNCRAYEQCNQLSNCYAEDIDSSGGNAYGFYDCDDISTSYCTDIDSATGTYYGFQNCTQVTGCDAQFCEDGFNACFRITGCRAANNDNDGYMACSYISGSIALSNGNDGFEDCSIISASASNSNTGNGFDNCKNMTANRASGNTAANYLNSTADWAGANPCADTAAGGYNS